MFLLTRLYRILIKDKYIPSTCNAYQWLPISSMHICDCKNVCKFPPNGNATKAKQQIIL